MNQETVTQIQEALKPLADKLGEAAQVVYESYYRHAIVTGILQISIPVVLGVLAIVFGTRWWKYCDRQVEYERAKTVEYSFERNDDLWRGAQFGLLGALALTFLIGGTWAIADGIQHVANPHYYAIHDLLSDIRK